MSKTGWLNWMADNIPADVQERLNAPGVRSFTGVNDHGETIVALVLPREEGRARRILVFHEDAEWQSWEADRRELEGVIVGKGWPPLGLSESELIWLLCCFLMATGESDDA
jgi:hypothetical protein